MTTAMVQYPDKCAKQYSNKIIAYSNKCARYQRYSRLKYLGIKMDLEKENICPNWQYLSKLTSQ
jgi:hypothetical protein